MHEGKHCNELATAYRSVITREFYLLCSLLFGGLRQVVSVYCSTFN